MTPTDLGVKLVALADECSRHRREYDSGEAIDLSKKVEHLCGLVATLVEGLMIDGVI